MAEHGEDFAELRRQFQARTTGKRMHTTLVNKVARAVRSRRLHNTIDDLITQVNQQYDNASTAHDRYVIEAGIDPNDVNAVAWMQELRDNHNRCHDIVDNFRAPPRGQWNVTAADPHGPEILPNNSVRADTNEQTGERLDETDQSILNSSIIPRNYTTLDITGNVDQQQQRQPLQSTTLDASHPTESNNDDSKRRKLELELQLELSKRQEARAIEDLKRKAQRDQEDILLKIQMENSLAPQPSLDAQIPNVSSAFGRIQLSDNQQHALRQGFGIGWHDPQLSTGIQQSLPTHAPQQSIGVHSTAPSPAGQPVQPVQHWIMPHPTQPFPQVRAPKIAVLEFNGDARTFPRFRLTFKASVNGANVSDETKLISLFDNLSEDVRKLNAHIFNGSHTFEQAWNKLEQRYGTPSLIIHAHLLHLSQVSEIRQNDFKGLFELAALVRDAVSHVPDTQAASEFTGSTVVTQLSAKLPIDLQRDWSKCAYALRPSLPSLKDFDAWLEKTVGAEQMRGAHLQQQSVVQPTTRQSTVAPKATTYAPRDSRNLSAYGPTVLSSSVASGSAPNRSTPLEECAACNTKPYHRLEHCEIFRKMQPNQRASVVAKGYCFKCLGHGHIGRNCTTSNPVQCKECSKPHHPLLHGAERQFPAKTVEGNSILLVRAPELKRGPTPVLLAIVPVTIIVKSLSIDTFAVLDPGSEATLITKQLSSRLGTEGRRVNIRFGSFHQSTIMDTCVVGFEIASRAGGSKFVVRDAYVVPEIRLSPRRINWPEIKCAWDHLTEIDLPPVDSATVELLIGGDVAAAHDVLDQARPPPGSSEPGAKLTPFGWTVFGTIPLALVVGPSAKLSVNLCSTQSTSLVETVTRFYTAEKYTTNNATSPDDFLAIQALERSAKFIGCGWQTDLLLKTPHFELPNNRKFAVSRFLSTEKRLLLPGNEEYLMQYNATVDKLITRGYLARVPYSQIHLPVGRVWHLPHHFVLYPNKPGKIRVVLDCAARFQGVCLNDLLLRGPLLLSKLVGVLLRSRDFPVCVTGDIEAFYHRISVSPEHRSLLRFLWRLPGTDGPLITYQMTSHVFGATSSSTVACWTLQHAANQNKQFPEVAARIKENFYADNMCDSFETEEDAIKFTLNVTESLRIAGFRLTGFASSSRRLVATIPPNERACSVKDLDFDQPSVEYLLGVAWHCDTDVYRIRVRPATPVSTRREMLAVMARTFDPLGLCLPVVTFAKILFQSTFANDDACCRAWDKPLPADVLVKWSSWANELNLLSEVSVQRCIRPTDFLSSNCSFTLHVFADASLAAYGAVAYVRTSCANQVCVRFVMAKGRLAPLRKITTIPRLELQAALLAAELASAVKEESRLPLHDTTLYSDSMVTLHRIHSPPPADTYEGTRVKKILNFSRASEWEFVPGEKNPADECTRGMTATRFISPSSRWITGPEFLQQPLASSPSSNTLSIMQNQKLAQGAAVHMVGATEVESSAIVLPDRMKEVSKMMRQPDINLTQLKRQVATALRQNNSEEEELNAGELKEALRVCLQVANQESYPKEYGALASKKPIAKGSRLRRVTPFIGGDGLLRVSGRLEHADTPEHARFPVILDADHPLTALVIADIHQNVQHGGVERTLAEARWHYYFPQGRRAVRRTLAKCRKCKLDRAQPQPPFMASLPHRRLQAFCPAFTNVGLDLFGHFNVVIGRRREKRWGLIITCLSTRAVHLEALSSLSADSFLMALRRFVADRGRPKSISSDNGTNLVAGDKEMKEGIDNLNSKLVVGEMADKGIEWFFTPPSGQHFGGAWERLVQSSKRALRSILENQAVTDEVFQTVLKEVASLLNSRPLTNVCSDPNEPEPLTPNHFILGNHAPHIPADLEENFDGLSRRRWKQSQYLVNQYWRRWMKEYVPTLIERKKWDKHVRPIRVGDEVLILDENTRRGDWPIGFVVQTFPDGQKVVRKAVVKTAKGVYTRPVVKLCLISEGPVHSPTIPTTRKILSHLDPSQRP